jgi:regulator of protease activity HflC (stomatin/prohibitin superfamily)
MSALPANQAPRAMSNRPTIEERILVPPKGFFMALMLFLLLLVNIFLFISGNLLAVLGGVGMFVLLFLLSGLITIQPNESRVLVLFGQYKGTVKDNGFFLVNPFYSKTKISLRARNLNGQVIKVNDKLGNPIEIAAVIVWRVEDTAKAAFDVDNYTNFVNIQSEAAVRHLANTYSYDHFTDDGVAQELTLRGSSEEVAQQLEIELNERLAPAGIRVMEARLSHLSYASEIAGAMLQRQQATAVVAARKQIVEGAVGMVEMALERLASRGIIELTGDRKAAMISNLLVVLCSERAASPVVNAGVSGGNATNVYPQGE